MRDKKLYKSRRDRKIFGVCGGLAEYFGIDSTLVRVIALIAILAAGLSIWVYPLAALVMPEAPNDGTYYY